MRVKKMMLAALTAASLSIGVAACATACGGKKTDVVVPAEGPETCVYYYDVAGDEYLITLNNADKVAFAVNGENKSGTYVLDGSTLKFTFYGENGDPLTATYAEGEITLTFGGETMRFLKKIKYTVSFDVAGGSEGSAVAVLRIPPCIRGGKARDRRSSVRRSTRFPSSSVMRARRIPRA